MTIADWARVAEPQKDEHDTEILRNFRDSGSYANYRRTNGQKIWLDGDAAWTAPDDTNTFAPDPSFRPLSPEHPRVQEGLELLNLWPEARRQCARLLTAVSPMTLGNEGGHGCSCGQFNDDFGWIYVTADDPWGFAEGIVHEMAHWKLRALGIFFEEWGPELLTNAREERYASPVRKDTLRPMGAVLHGQYSYVHVAEMTSRSLAAKGRPNAQDVDWLELHLSRINEGQATLRTNAKGTTNAGEPFLNGLDGWTSRTLKSGYTIIAEARQRAA